jgi:hypothetical protein
MELPELNQEVRGEREQQPASPTEPKQVVVISYDHDDLVSRTTNSTFSQAKAFASRLYEACGIVFSAENGPWLAGGAVRRSVLGLSDEGDFDLFFKNEEQLNAVIDALDIANTDSKMTTISKTEDVDTILWETSGDIPHTYKIQLIYKRTYGSLTDLLDSFDFTVCQFAYAGDKIYAGQYSLWDLGRKRLAVHRITFPVSSVRRMIKYGNQGFYVCNGAITAILNTVVQQPDLLDTRWTYVD